MTKKLVSTSIFGGYNSANSDILELGSGISTLERLHHVQGQGGVPSRIAAMIIDVVPHFDNQVTANKLKNHKVVADALYTTMIRLGQNPRAEVALDDLISLIPWDSTESWLTDRLMDSLIYLTRPYQPGSLWFCSDGLLQTCMKRIMEMASHWSHQEFEQQLENLRLDSILPGREIPEDAKGIVFFHNPTGAHWVTILAGVDPVTMLGHISVFDCAEGKLCEDRPDRFLPYLLRCLSHESENQLFERANWFAVDCFNGVCQKQSGSNDCGVFAVYAAWFLLGKELYPRADKFVDDQSRRKAGLELRVHYMKYLRDELDMTEALRGEVKVGKYSG